MDLTRVLTLSIALACSALPAAMAAPPARQASADCSVRVVDGWVRQPPVSMPMLAGFGRIENPCREARVVVGVRSDAFADVSLHETRIVDGVSRMRPVPRLTVPAGGSVELQPGGLHLMLVQPRGALEAGDSIEVVLELEGGQTRAAGFELRASTGR